MQPRLHYTHHISVLIIYCIMIKSFSLFCVVCNASKRAGPANAAVANGTLRSKLLLLAEAHLEGI